MCAAPPSACLEERPTEVARAPVFLSGAFAPRADRQHRVRSDNVVSGSRRYSFLLSFASSFELRCRSQTTKMGKCAWCRRLSSVATRVQSCSLPGIPLARVGFCLMCSTCAWLRRTYLLKMRLPSEEPRFFFLDEQYRRLKASTYRSSAIRLICYSMFDMRFPLLEFSSAACNDGALDDANNQRRHNEPPNAPSLVA